MKITSEISEVLLAPCGVNCLACYMHLRKKKPCLGCLGQENSKPEHCRICKIKTCTKNKGVDYCFSCSMFPCEIIKRLDKSYRTRYQISIIEDAIKLRAIGSKWYLQEERKRWKCSACDGIVSMHDKVCSECGEER